MCNGNWIIMKRLRSILAGLLILTSVPAFSQYVSNDNDDEVNKVNDHFARQAFRDGEIIVKFNPQSAVNVKRRANGKFVTSSVGSVDAVLRAVGVDEMEELMPNIGNTLPSSSRMKVRDRRMQKMGAKDLSKMYRLKLSKADVNTFDVIESLKELDEVEFAEPNYLVYTMATPEDFQTDPLYSTQWGIPAINLPQLWAQTIITENRPVIAILDTGVDISHPDLVDNIWTNEKEMNGEEGYDNDNNGFRSDIHGWDFINNTSKINDYNGHGTHCAGIAGASGGNQTGITGANPDALIMPITVMQSDGVGDIATIIKGIDYAVANGADIISMSLGTYSNSSALKQALAKAYQKTIIIAAAGNDTKCINVSHLHFPLPAPMFPAAYNFVLGVQASSDSGRALFSNYDDDGPVYSVYGEEGLYNYELTAPGVNIMSTFPNGNYRSLNGTSMACPLVAGAVSRLIQTKEYDNKETLFGDLIRSSSNNLDIFNAYLITDEDRQPTLNVITYTIDDSEGDDDGRPDAGEIISIYPTLRNEWGLAKNINLSLEMGEFEGASLIEFIDSVADFGYSLSGYGKAVSANPLKFRISENCADARHIRLVLKATCDNISEEMVQNITIEVTNAETISGVLSRDTTLTADKVWLVESNLAVPEGVTLTIEPGTRLEFNTDVGIKCDGTLNACGEPGKMIVFTNRQGQGSFKGIEFNNTSTSPSYWIIDGLKDYSRSYDKILNNCIIRNMGYRSSPIAGDYNVHVNNNYYTAEVVGEFFNYCNFVHCKVGTTYSDESAGSFCWENIHNLNILNIETNKSNIFITTAAPSKIQIVTNDIPSYLGTAREDLLHKRCYEIGNVNYSYSTFDLSNILTRPVAEAHGIVWKVVVNGYDAQDEFEDLPPLGVGRHKFEVYFNRPMNKEVTPTITMGVRQPYTQTPIAEDGEWNEEGDVYTAYLTISGKNVGDGLNRIYVAGAEDDEFFEIPYESTRFNVLVQAAGSMSTGFEAEAGLGRVSLEWEIPTDEFDDLLGYNLYRYTLDNEGNQSTPLKINEQLLESTETSFVDYEVVPNETYYYYYKVMTTDLAENDPSKVVAATPQTSVLGDANGSGEVDVADVITTVNYAAGMDPKPFIFDAADMNIDQTIDIIDVVGIIQTILNPNAPAKARTESVATYTIEDGILYVESPVNLAGVQVQLNIPEHETPEVLESLNGFERASAWLTDEDYIFLAYNMNGKTLPAGKHAIMKLGDKILKAIRLSDKYGQNVGTEPGNVTSINDMSVSNILNSKGIYNLNGQKVAGKAEDINRLPHGVYIVNGQKIVK